MIGKWLRSIPKLLIFICVGTIIAQMVMLGFLASRGMFAQDRLYRILCAIHGIEPPVQPQKTPLGIRAEDTSQPSHAELIEARLVSNLNLDYRRQAIENGLDELRYMQETVKQEKQQYRELVDEFQVRLATIRAEAGQSDELELMLGEMKPKQAKDQLLIMLKEEAMPTVVVLLEQMPADKRKKIFAEFKTEEELQTLADILKEIRLRSPEMELLDETEQQLNDLQSGQSS